MKTTFYTYAFSKECALSEEGLKAKIGPPFEKTSMVTFEVDLNEQQTIKLAGILDKPQENLCNEVWTERMTLRPELRKDILEMVHKIQTPDKIVGVYILGSITGYKYTETSDVDVMLIVDGYTPQMKEIANDIAGPTTNSGRHPVNVNVKERPTTHDISFQDVYFGVYNVIDNDWEALPPKKEIYRDPNAEFKLEILYAKKIAQDFNYKVNRLRETLRALSRLKRVAFSLPALGKFQIIQKRNSIQKQVKDLAEMAHSLEDDRKFAYKWGWGTPRKDFRNILYKVIEHGPYGNLFLLLEKVIIDEFGDVPQSGTSKLASADSLLTKAVKKYKKGESNILPTPMEYHDLKNQERRAIIESPSIRRRSLAGAGIGFAIGAGLDLKKNKTVRTKRTALSTLAGSLILGGSAINRKLKAGKDIVNPERDIAQYGRVINKHLIEK